MEMTGLRPWICLSRTCASWSRSSTNGSKMRMHLEDLSRWKAPRPPSSTQMDPPPFHAAALHVGATSKFLVGSQRWIHILIIELSELDKSTCIVKLLNALLSEFPLSPGREASYFPFLVCLEFPAKISYTRWSPPPKLHREFYHRRLIFCPFARPYVLSVLPPILLSNPCVSPLSFRLSH